ncbi:hypothetical protein C1646_662397 [Rhizophagus diaphanus]|nr:hypothetical protein C1646_662397 [Rhizophagus diaphanus] [Rhizophagus sp. MUCL 43196]
MAHSNDEVSASTEEFIDLENNNNNNNNNDNNDNEDQNNNEKKNNDISKIDGVDRRRIPGDLLRLNLGLGLIIKKSGLAEKLSRIPNCRSSEPGLNLRKSPGIPQQSTPEPGPDHAAANYFSGLHGGMMFLIITEIGLLLVLLDLLLVLELSTKLKIMNNKGVLAGVSI